MSLIILSGSATGRSGLALEQAGLATPVVPAALDAKLVELEVSGRHAPAREA